MYLQRKFIFYAENENLSGNFHVCNASPQNPLSVHRGLLDLCYIPINKRLIYIEYSYKPELDYLGVPVKKDFFDDFLLYDSSKTIYMF